MNTGLSNPKANVLRAADPHFSPFVGPEFPSSLQHTGSWINLSNKQLGAKIMSNRISK